jgi:hypothetical protein
MMIEVVHYYSEINAILTFYLIMDEVHPSTSNFIYKLDKND